MYKDNYMKLSQRIRNNSLFKAITNKEFEETTGPIQDKKGMLQISNAKEFNREYKFNLSKNYKGSRVSTAGVAPADGYFYVAYNKGAFSRILFVGQDNENDITIALLHVIMREMGVKNTKKDYKKRMLKFVFTKLFTKEFYFNF